MFDSVSDDGREADFEIGAGRALSNIAPVC